MTAPSKRLAELGIVLPPTAPALGSYRPAKRVGGLVYTAGQLPLVDGELVSTGKVGDAVTPDEARELARVCALNGLAALDDVVETDHVVEVVKVVGFVASAPGFSGQPAVLDGASTLLAEVFGEAGVHVRSAVGVAELPRNSPVEVELVVSIG